MSVEIKLAYGIRNERIVHISEIRPQDNGEKCNCICPACNGTLLARMGKKNRPHFSHKVEGNCNIENAQQTGIHLLAKEIIRDNHSILLPGYKIESYDVVPNDCDSFIVNSIDFSQFGLPRNEDCRKVKYTFNSLEKKYGDIIADAAVIIGNRLVLIEIAVTHFVDKIKSSKLSNSKQTAFEIDLSEYINKAPSREEIIGAVLYNRSNRRWIYNPKREALLLQRKKDFQTQYDLLKVASDNMRAGGIEDDIKRHSKLDKEQRITTLQKLFIPENYGKEVRSLRNDAQAKSKLFSFSFSVASLNYPFFLDIPITGEFVFPIDRRIWQSTLFDNYYFHVPSNEPPPFRMSKVNMDIKTKSLPSVYYDEKKIESVRVIIDGEDQDINLYTDITTRYFEYLALLGFFLRDGYLWFANQPSTLEPPNIAAAAALRDSLQCIDPLSPNVNKQIKKELLKRLQGDDKETVLHWK